MNLLLALTVLQATVPNPAPVVPPGLGQATDLILSWIKWGSIAVATGSGFVAAGMIGLGRRGGRSQMGIDGIQNVGWALGSAIAVTVVAGLIGGVLAVSGT